MLTDRSPLELAEVSENYGIMVRGVGIGARVRAKRRECKKIWGIKEGEAIGDSGGCGRLGALGRDVLRASCWWGEATLCGEFEPGKRWGEAFLIK